ncbi:MAG: hypothetical protein ACRECL_11950, partial [Bradyrhizobium sp.]
SRKKYEGTLAVRPSNHHAADRCCADRTRQTRRRLGLVLNVKKVTVSLSIVTCILPANCALADQVRVVVPNNAYADIARQVGGSAVTVLIADGRGDDTSMIQPKSIILCGWARADKALRETARRASPTATLIELPRGASDESLSVAVPWYDTSSMFTLARAYADQLMRMRPAFALQFAGNLAYMQAGFDAVSRRIGEIARDYASSEVIAADPLSRRVANTLGFKVVDPASAHESRGAISEESFKELEKELEGRYGSIFLYDRDAAQPEMKKLVAVANQNDVPPVGLQDKLPTALRYQQWVLRQWNAIHGALNEASP